MNLSLQSLRDDVPAGALRALAQHWLDLYHQAGNRVPRLRAVDPLRFAAALQDTWIIDAGDDGRFRFRLCGEALVEWYGFSLRGRSFEEILSPASLAATVAQARDVVGRPMAIYHRMVAMIPDCSRPAGFGRVALPLADGDGRIRHLLGATCFDRPVINGRGSIATRPELERRYDIPALASAA